MPYKGNLKFQKNIEGSSQHGERRMRNPDRVIPSLCIIILAAVLIFTNFPWWLRLIEVILLIFWATIFDELWDGSPRPRR